MTLQELCDWHAARVGWSKKLANGYTSSDGDDAYYWIKDGKVQWDHPILPTLDGADASFPKGWEWGRTPPRGDWCAVSLERGITEQTAYTGDKPRDLYELSKLAWEQEAAR